VNNTLFVIGVVSNPAEYASRIKLYKEFRTRMEETRNVVLITVELAYNNKKFAVTNKNNEHDLQLRTGEEGFLWVKESLINLGVKHLSKLYPDYKYVAWVDGDIEFMDEDWAEKTIEALEKFKVVQPWTIATDLGPSGQHLKKQHSFCYVLNSKQAPILEGNTNKIYHPGYAWAMRRDAFESLNGLIDFSPIGTGDHHMAWAFMSQVYKGIAPGTDPKYIERCHLYKLACDKVIHKSVGYIHGNIRHHWHGNKGDRGYQKRWEILSESNFDVTKDLSKNNDGLVVLSGNNEKLALLLKAYFHNRKEDAR
jgi:hypothetical protein